MTKISQRFIRIPLSSGKGHSFELRYTMRSRVRIPIFLPTPPNNANLLHVQELPTQVVDGSDRRQLLVKPE
jgi:hypothetical protein